MNLNQIPRSLLVFIVLVIGVLSFFVLKRPHSVCDSQIEVFKELQRGVLFANGNNEPKVKAMLATCRAGSSPGACYELFAALRKIVRDLQSLPNDCQQGVSEVDNIRNILMVGSRLMVELAWGSAPPEPGISRLGWLEASDLALFCGLRDQTIRLFGAEVWDDWRLLTYDLLPGEKSIFKDGVCINCEDKKKAAQSMSQEEIWNRSVYSIRCDQFR